MSSSIELPSAAKTSLKRSRLLYPTPAPLTRYSPLPPTPGTYPGRDLASHSCKIAQKAAMFYPTVTSVERDEAGASDVQATMMKAQKTSHSREAGGRSKRASGAEGSGRLMITQDESGVRYNNDGGANNEGGPSSSTALALMPGQKSGLKKTATKTSTALALMKEKTSDLPIPKWHAPWRLSAVISGHLGWVRSIAFDPSNAFFATGSSDRTIKIWDFPKSTTASPDALKLTLTGHISAVRGLALSDRHPYLFSCAEDKMVKCWDLEVNRCIRQYHGHLSGVHCLALHPTLDVLITGGRDSVARVWDIRTKNQIHVLSGHENTVGSILANTTDPQIITGSHDQSIKTWDLAAGKCMTTLTHHKKSIRALAAGRNDRSFLSGAADNVKKWGPGGDFIRNFPGHKSVINSLSTNQEGVAVSCGDDGTMEFWDYDTGYNFQSLETVAQPGSLDAERGIFASSFDGTGTRLITCEADKSLKVWKETDQTEEEVPVDLKEWKKVWTREKRGRI